jgi:hypothetical protein
VSQKKNCAMPCPPILLIESAAIAMSESFRAATNANVATSICHAMRVGSFGVSYKLAAVRGTAGEAHSQTLQ